MMSYANWYVQAVTWLDAGKAESVLLDAFNEPEYERESGWGLVHLARNQDVKQRWGPRGPDYRIVWEARRGQRASGFNEDQRQRYADVIKDRILAVLDERGRDHEPDKYNNRFKTLATMLAILDGRGSADLVMGILALPGEWDGWMRADALEELLFGGAALPAEATLNVINPVIENTLKWGVHNEQNSFLLKRCLCLLPFVDEPSAGIDRIRRVLSEAKFGGYQLREVVTAQLSPKQRFLLSKVVARFGTRDVLLAGLNLIGDGVNPPVPYDLMNAIESVFLERQRYGNTGSTDTLVPRDSNEIRTRLFEMALNDETRKHSAFALLGQIEAWRLEYGKPLAEPRHPAFDSGKPWLPIGTGI